MEIQEALATAQINTFWKALERAQRIESAKCQLRAFQTRETGTPGGNLGKARENAPPPKAGREVGGMRFTILPPLPQGKPE